MCRHVGGREGILPCHRHLQDDTPSAPTPVTAVPREHSEIHRAGRGSSGRHRTMEGAGAGGRKDAGRICFRFAEERRLGRGRGGSGGAPVTTRPLSLPESAHSKDANSQNRRLSVVLGEGRVWMDIDVGRTGLSRSGTTVGGGPL